MTPVLDGRYQQFSYIFHSLKFPQVHQEQIGTYRQILLVPALSNLEVLGDVRRPIGVRPPIPSHTHLSTTHNTLPVLGRHPIGRIFQQRIQSTQIDCLDIYVTLRLTKTSLVLVAG